MTVELLQTISLVSFIAAGVLLLVAIALFFILDVPKLYGDISGRTAKKAIKEIREQNESSGNKAYKPSAVNAARGKITDKITSSGKLKQHTDELQISVGTEKITVASQKSQTNETTVLDFKANETTVLDFRTSETTVLTGELYTEHRETADFEKSFITAEPSERKVMVESEFSFTGSSEIIE